MPKVRSKAEANFVPWWLVAGNGDEECPHCGQLYILEHEFRCPDCDGPGCTHCKKTHAEGHQTCPECASADESRAHG